MAKKDKKQLYQDLPETPGIYLMKNAEGKIIYIGKAVNLKRRVTSYFTRPQDVRIAALVEEIVSIDYEECMSALEALILEAARIKKHKPRYNIQQKDNKSFLYVEITNEEFPQVQLVRGRSPIKGTRYGPFLGERSIREGIRILRKIIPFAIHGAGKKGDRPCFDYQINLCPGTCASLVTKREYNAAIRKLKLLFEGNHKELRRTIKRDMNRAAKNLDFEKAESIKRTLFALDHVNDVSIITRPEVMQERERSVRIEGYDISHTGGKNTVGSMVVFVDGRPEKKSYRKFKIKTATGPDDTGSLKEMLERRLNHEEWPYPDVFLIDGGVGQVNAVRKVLQERKVETPVVGIAKGSERKRNDFIGAVPHIVSPATLIKVRDEAHRFAITYHKKVRKKDFFS